MSKGKTTYLLFYKYTDSTEDRDWSELGHELVEEIELDDITSLMKRNGVTECVDNDLSTWEKWSKGQGKLMEARNVKVRPIKIVEAWSYQPDREAK